MNANVLATLVVVGALIVFVAVIAITFLPKIIPALEALPR